MGELVTDSLMQYKSATSQSNPSIGTARKVLGILQNHYVERVSTWLLFSDRNSSSDQVLAAVWSSICRRCNWSGYLVIKLISSGSWWINAFFSGISPFMDPITRDKVSPLFCHSSLALIDCQIRFNPKMTELVPAAQLDAEFGGDYNFEYDYPTYWKTITDFCHLVRLSVFAGIGGGLTGAGPGWQPIR